MSYRIAIVAGEASGDMHGAALARGLKSIRPDVVLAGIGGEEMRDAGVRIWEDPTRLGAVGLVEVLMKMAAFKKLFDFTLKSIIEMRPDVVVLIDYPGFNMRLGRRLHQEGFRCVYYIPPTAWAWGRRRADRVASFSQKVLSILPFEVDVYREAGADVEFIGHPLLDRIDSTWIQDRLGLHFEGIKILGLFPGSRDHEVDALLPIMLQSVRLVLERCKNVVVELSVAPTVDERRILRHVATSGVDVRLYSGDAPSLMRRCFCGIVASGTATLEAALVGMPMVIVYKVSPITAFVFRRLLTISLIGLPNTILGRQSVPELVQENCTPGRIAEEVIRYCSDSAYYKQVVSDFLTVRSLLGEPGAVQRAAQIILSIAEGSCKEGVGPGEA